MEINKDYIASTEEQGDNPFEQFSLPLMLYMLRLTLPWIIGALILVGTCVAVYLRYTPPIYQASATLMIKTQKTTQLLGLQDILKEDRLEINREIQVLQSRFMMEQIYEDLPLATSYFRIGRSGLVATELYTSTPFEVKATIKGAAIYDVPIYVSWQENGAYLLSYTMGNERFEFPCQLGKPCTTPHFDMVMHANVSNISDENEYYFTFNDKARVIEQLTKQIRVFPLDPRTQTVRITLDDANKTKAQEIVRDLTNSFVAYDKVRKAESVAGIIKFLSSQVDTFSGMFQTFQDTFNNFQVNSGFTSPGERLTSLSGKIEELDIESAKLQERKRQLQWLLRQLDEQQAYGSSLLYSMGDDMAFVGFESKMQRILSLQEERAQILLDVTENHPEVVLIDADIQRLDGLMKDEIRFAISSLDNQYAKLRGDIQMAVDELYSLPEKESKYGQFQKQREQQENFFQNLLDKQAQYLIAQAGIVSDYIILQAPTVSPSPIAPNSTIIWVVAISITLILGVIAVIVRYFVYRKITSPEELKRLTGLPLLGIVPKYKLDLEHSNIVVTQNPKSIISESFREIRSNLQFFAPKGDANIFSVTSTVSGEGKTFVSLNLAAILSLLDKRVIIIDLDMRRPRLEKVFNVDNSKGMSNILIGQSYVEECIFSSGHPNLDFITAGPVPPNPSELIMLPAMHETLYQLRNSYDYIVIDTPPVGLVTDASEITRLSDHLIYVFRADYSQRDFSEVAKRIKADKDIDSVSMVLNDLGRGASQSASSSSMKYGYGYGTYGYGYYSDDFEEKPSFVERIKSLLLPRS